jgi:hypothetical protein
VLENARAHAQRRLDHPSVAAAIAAKGDLLLLAVLLGFTDALPPTVPHEHFADTLQLMLQPPQANSWLQRAFASGSFCKATEHLSAAERNAIGEVLWSARGAQPRRFRLISQNVSQICRQEETIECLVAFGLRMPAPADV